MDVKITLSSTEHKELISFCNLNDLLVSETVKKSYMNGFNIERFGLLNSGQETIEKEVIKEVIKYVEVPVVEEKEVIKIEYVELPVEKIVEVVKYIDVPVEIIKEVDKEVIKEVFVEKETTENSLKPKLDALQTTVQKLRQEILDKDKLIKEYQNTIDDIRKYQGETKAVYLKGSNLDNKLYK